MEIQRNQSRLSVLVLIEVSSDLFLQTQKVRDSILR